MRLSEDLFIFGGYLVIGVVYVFSLTGWQRSSVYYLTDLLSDILAVLIWPVILLSRTIQVIVYFLKRRK